MRKEAFRMKNNKVKIIAEIANAHQGKGEELLMLIREVAKTGADGVKFQWFKYDYLATPDYEKYDIFKDLFITEDYWDRAVKMAKDYALEIWVDIFDVWGLELAMKFEESIYGFKIPPTVLQSDYLVEGISKMNKPVLIGVGGWYDQEIDDVIRKIKDKIKSEVFLMHGFQGYPTQTEDANLSRISYLRTKYKLQVGYADHEDASERLAMDLPIYAYFAGASIIEKHITLDRSKKGHDYYSSLEPDEFKDLVLNIREAEVAMGDNSVNESQRSYLKDASRVVALSKIGKGEIITKNKVVLKRTSNKEAMFPTDFFNFLPAVAINNIDENSGISVELIRKPKVVISVICRLKSTRLHKKALIKFNGVAAIERCLINCKAAKQVDEVVLCTSNLSDDDELTKYNLNGDISIVRGDADNVVERMLLAAEVTGCDIIIRATGDNPVTSPEIIDLLVSKHLESGSDFTTSDNNVAMGTSVEVYNVSALKKLKLIDKELSHTEFLPFYFKNNPHIFKNLIVSLPKEYQHSDWRLTLDEPIDEKMFNELFTKLNKGQEPLFFKEIVEFIDKNQDIININKNVNVVWKDYQDLVNEINIKTTFK